MFLDFSVLDMCFEILDMSPEIPDKCLEFLDMCFEIPDILPLCEKLALSGTPNQGSNPIS